MASIKQGIEKQLITEIERNNYLREDFAKISDSSQKFTLKKQIEDSDQEIARLKQVLANTAENEDMEIRKDDATTSDPAYKYKLTLGAVILFVLAFFLLRELYRYVMS